MTFSVSSLQTEIDADQERGYRGAKVDPLPNSAYSQETDPMTSPGSGDQPRGGYRMQIDEFADPDNPHIADIHGRVGLTDTDVLTALTQHLTGSVDAQATAGTAGANKELGQSQFDGTVTAVSMTPVGTITGDATNNRTFKVYNKTAGHALFTVTTTATKTAGVSSALVADGSNQSVSEGDELEIRQTVGGTGVAHTGVAFTVTIVATDAA